MPATIGIRRETKSPWERRVPLTPAHVRELVAGGLTVIVQPSANRIFPDADYAAAGARLEDDLAPCDAVFAVKEIPVEELLADKTYVFFSHTVKGQSHNMPLLDRLIERRCRLIDYERITDDQGRRLIFFGRHAGYAGMIDTLHAYGARLAGEGLSTPFAEIQPAHRYPDLASALAHLRQVGERLAQRGLPAGVAPLVVGVAGYGNVAQGAIEVLAALPVTTLTPAELLSTDPATLSPHQVYQVVFHELDLVTPTQGQAFALDDYYRHPEGYTGRFADYLDRLGIVVNALYWEPRYPRLIRREDIQALWRQADPRLKVIGDLGCDIGGTVEITAKATSQEQPTFVYLPGEDRIVDGTAGPGPVVLAVDNLPCELPAESSQAFSEALYPFVSAIAQFAHQDGQAGLPDPIRRATITADGQLTPDYRYLSAFLPIGAKQ